MKKRENTRGIRSDKLWKKIIACFYYLFCIIIIFYSFNSVPQIQADVYDTIIYKASVIVGNLAFLIPSLILTNFNIKCEIPFLKDKKWLSNILCFISIFITIICISGVINLFHSNDYKIRLKEFNKFQETNKDIEEKKDGNSTEEDNENIDNGKNNDADNNDKDNENEEFDNTNTVENNLIKIHFIDVGQGDSIFIELPNKKVMLIDAGESSKGKIVSSYISNLGYSKIDYVIGTHPHTDHIGGLAHIINTFDIGNIYMPKTISTSKTYENLLNTISQKGLTITAALAGVNIVNEDNLNINIIAPNKEYSDLNNSSAVVKITYGIRKFLLMGDAEIKSENDITSDVSADLIKIGHHGSDTSSGQSFVNKVKPKYAIIMVGNNNQYNHPYQVIIDRWINAGATVYRTDINGNIIAISDGNSLDVSTSR